MDNDLPLVDVKNTPITNSNPLSGYFRQPKIYIALPSKGKFYPQGTLDVSSNGQYAVFAMTAKDELMFKTPDALLNGQSTVEIIKSCIPAIKDPWHMPTIDVDAALIAIRIATYGENMEIESNCPKCNTENNYEVPLTDYLNLAQQFNFASTISVGELTIHMVPYTYNQMTTAGLKAMEQQRVFEIINNEQLSDKEKIEKFQSSFANLTSLTVDTITDCIAKVESPNGVTDDKNHIRDFINNAPKDVFEAVSEHIKKMRESVDIPNQQLKCTECETEYEVPLSMDQSDFFAKRS